MLFIWNLITISLSLSLSLSLSFFLFLKEIILIVSKLFVIETNIKK